MNSVYTVSLALSGCAFFIILILFGASLAGGHLKEPVFHWFFYLSLFCLLAVLCEGCLWLLLGTPGQLAYALCRCLDFLESLFSSLQIVALGRYLYAYLGPRNTLGAGPLRLVEALCAANVALAAVGAFTGWFARFDANNFYQRQPGFWLSVLLPVAALSACMGITLLHARVLRARQWASLVLYILMLGLSYILEAAFAGLWVSHLGSALVLLLLYINIQVETAHEQRARLSESRITLMLSQIQPHFLYNTLTAIDALCLDNPKAHKAMVTFSQYLRANMASLSQKEPIPFEQELKHVQQYLWLEELRFEEGLRVEYDIQASGFMLPVLTVQPLVENAVKHGVTGPGASGGCIRIHSEETENGYRVVVADDGTGFDAQQVARDGKLHTGMDNVRGRLATMCGGTLTVHSTPGKGTVATIEIPKPGAARKGRQTP